MSATLAALIAHAVFWALLAVGFTSGELSPRGVVVVVFLWLVGLVGLPYLTGNIVPFASYVALIDVALVFVIFKGDLPVT